MKCIHCSNDATYVSPDNLCTKHWVEWILNYGQGMSKEEYYKERKRLIKEIREQHGE